MLEKIQDADWALVLDLLQHAVDDDVGPCATHPGTEEQNVEQYERSHENNSPILSLNSLISGAPCVHVVPAVHQDWTHVRSACRWGAVDEGEDREGVLRYSHVRPLSVVILDNEALV